MPEIVEIVEDVYAREAQLPGGLIQWYVEDGVAHVSVDALEARTPREFFDGETAIHLEGPAADLPRLLWDARRRARGTRPRPTPTTAASTAKPTKEETDPHTDLRNSELLVEQHRGEFLYVPEWKCWFVYDGRRWRRIAGTGAVARYAKQVVREMLFAARKRAAAAADELNRTFEQYGARSPRTAEAKRAYDQALADVTWAKRSQSKNRIDAMISLAQTAAEVCVDHEAFDADHDLLNVENGTLDTRTGRLRRHRREDMITKLAPVVFVEEATAPQWEKFLSTVVPDVEVRTLLQRFAGCCLTGDVTDRVFLFLYGSGRNGKSVFLRVLRTILGEYAIVAAPDLLMAKKGETTHPTEIADLHSARLVVCQEVPKNRSFNEQRVKELTGNEGAIKARRMNENFWSFVPTFKIAIGGNHQPRVHDDTDAIWDRMRLAPFVTRIADADVNRRLFEDLMTEAPGILAWAIRGCADWRQNGLPAPKAVAAATDSYRSSEDVIGRFLADSCVFHKDRRATSKELIEAARDWCASGGDAEFSKKALADRLKREGCTETRTKRARGWTGVGLLTPVEIRARDTVYAGEGIGVSDGDAGDVKGEEQGTGDVVTDGDPTSPLISKNVSALTREAIDPQVTSPSVTRHRDPFPDPDPDLLAHLFGGDTTDDEDAEREAIQAEGGGE